MEINNIACLCNKPLHETQKKDDTRFFVFFSSKSNFDSESYLQYFCKLYQAVFRSTVLTSCFVQTRNHQSSDVGRAQVISNKAHFLGPIFSCGSKGHLHCIHVISDKHVTCFDIHYFKRHFIIIYSIFILHNVRNNKDI